MRKVVIILPYFGHFNEYFQLWLNSCAISEDGIQWVVLTDDQTTYRLSENVSIIYEDFSNVQKRIHEIFGDNVKINTPYDLCLFRPAYCDIFSEQIKGYAYWGYCDCDLIFGDVWSDIKSPLSQGVPKISWRGHFTAFKNSKQINEAYKKEIPGLPTFLNAVNRVRVDNFANLFDEVGINMIFDHEGLGIYKGMLLADLRVKDSNFILNHFSRSEQNGNTRQIFEWNKGHLFRWYIECDTLRREEFYYIHFLRRKMHLKITTDCEHYLIVPNKFIPYEKVTKELIIKYSARHIYWDYYRKRLKPSYLIKSLINRFKNRNVLPLSYNYVIR